MRSLPSSPYPSQPSPSVGAGIGGAVLHEDRYVRSHASCSLVTVTIPGLFSLEHQLAGRPSHKPLRTVRTRADYWVLVVQNFRLIRLAQKKRMLIERRAAIFDSVRRSDGICTQGWSNMYLRGDIELSTHSNDREARFRETTVHLRRSNDVTAPLRCSIFTNDVLPLSPFVSTRPPACPYFAIRFIPPFFFGWTTLFFAIAHGACACICVSS